MNISVIPYYQLLHPVMCRGKTIILIDVFRASSFMVTAFAKGCEMLIPVETAQQARTLAGEADWLAGEYLGKPISDFQLDNSPTALIRSQISGKRVFLATTNGTCALQKTQQADQILIGSLLNLRAVAERAYLHQNEILLLCAGTRGTFSLEDGLAAGLIVEQIRSFTAVDCDDLAKLLATCVVSFSSINRVCRQSRSGKRLQHRGKEADLEHCLCQDLYSIVPQGKWSQDIKRNICEISSEIVELK